MKVSELINALQKAKDEHGDLPVYYGFDEEPEEAEYITFNETYESDLGWLPYPKKATVPNRITIT